MSSEEPDPHLERLLATVVSELNPIAVYLFGSRAEGRARPDSDYDLMVVVPNDAPDEHLDPIQAYKAGIKAHVPADIIPVSLEDFLNFRGALYSLPGRVHARGRLLYGEPL